MNEFTIWLKHPQNLKSLETEKSSLFRVMEKIYGVNFFFVLLFSLSTFLGGNCLWKQFFTIKFITLLSYNGLATLIFCFGLIS